MTMKFDCPCGISMERGFSAMIVVKVRISVSNSICFFIVSLDVLFPGRLRVFGCLIILYILFLVGHIICLPLLVCRLFVRVLLALLFLGILKKFVFSVVVSQRIDIRLILMQ